MELVKNDVKEGTIDTNIEASDVVRVYPKIKPTDGNCLIELVCNQYSTMSLRAMNKSLPKVSFHVINLIATDNFLSINNIGKEIIVDKGLFNQPGYLDALIVPNKHNPNSIHKLQDNISALTIDEYDIFLKTNPYVKIYEYALIPNHYIIGIVNE